MTDPSWTSFILSPVERYAFFHADDGKWLDIEWTLQDGKAFHVSLPDQELPLLIARLQHAGAVLAERRTPGA